MFEIIGNIIMDFVNRVPNTILLVVVFMTIYDLLEIQKKKLTWEEFKGNLRIYLGAWMWAVVMEQFPIALRMLLS